MNTSAMRRAVLIVLLYLLCINNAAVYAEESINIQDIKPAADAVAYDKAHPENLLPEQLAATAAVLMEASTGDIVFGKDADARMYPASTTKIMTALLALEYAQNNYETMDEALSQVITCSVNVTQVDSDGTVIGLREGERITFKDALYGMLLRSGNDAAVAVAEYVAGSEAAFVEQMNEAARLLRMSGTHFTNCHGLPDPDHYTTAHDLALATQAALKNSTFRRIISTVRYTIPQSNIRASINLANSNVMIDSTSAYYFSGMIGVKTGTTNDAGYCMVGAATRNGVTLISVVLRTGLYYRWWDTEKMLSYGFTQYDSLTPEQIYSESPIDVRTIGYSMDDPNRGELTLSIRAQNPLADVRITGPKEDVQVYKEQYRSYSTIQITSDLHAPIARGDVIGVLTFYTPDGDAPRYDLIASRDVALRVNAPLTIEQIAQMARDGEFLMFSWEWLAPPIAVGVAAIFILRAVFRWIRGKRRDARQIPKPRRRSYQ
ncbi:hypothetical protein AGMMS49992_23270 [Clostridia bacterium]|nr:hypothetical protein AGMMS49992_23270 [Clostridia bacterium]